MLEKHSSLRPFRLPVLILCLLISTLAVTAVLAGLVRAESYTLDVHTVGDGTVQRSAQAPYFENQQVTLTAVPGTGQEFVSWSADSNLKWWDLTRDYRISVTVGAGNYQRVNKPAEAEIDFADLLDGLGATEALDVNSIRVVEIDLNGSVIDENIPFQFDAATFINNGLTLPAKLVWIMPGATAKNSARNFHVYFDILGKGFTPPNVTPLVTESTANDEQKSSHKIESAGSTYYYHKGGAGFSSLDDVDDNDWINYAPPPDDAAIRGIPNMVHPNNGGLFHPGGNTSTTTLVYTGPLKITLHSIGKTGATKCWETTWEVYPEYARQTLLGRCGTPPYAYWWLYEGTPGGELDVNKDYLVLADGTTVLGKDSFQYDLPGDEWGYFVDPDVGRSIFFANHTNDDKVDSYAPTQDKETTKFGFGRIAAASQLQQVPAQFTFGLTDETAYPDTAKVIYNAYKPLDVTLGQPEERAGADLGDQNPLLFTITGMHVLTATFAPQQFTLNVTPDGQGAISRTPNKATYNYNESVKVQANPSPGWVFVEWQGGLSGSTNPATINMTADTTATAVFAPSYQLATSVSAGQGQITLNPPGGNYPAGTMVGLTAVGAPGWEFSGWGGALTGSTNPTSLTVNSDVTVTAAFAPASYTVALAKTGNGTVSKQPEQPSYDYGDVVTLTAVPETGWEFTGWTGDNTGMANPAMVTVTQDMVITGQFSLPADHTLGVSVVGQGSVGRSPDKPAYAEGEQVTLTAAPVSGSSFVGWSGDLTGSDNPAVITMDGDKQVTAVFSTGASLFTDSFGSCDLDPRWTFVNPLGDASADVLGSMLTIDVPGGQDHNPWNTGNNSPRIMQSVQNEDFQIDVSFESPITDVYQMQGFIVQQDDENFIRVEIASYRDKDSGDTLLRIYAASISGQLTKVYNDSNITSGNGALAMRLSRVGDSWFVATFEPGGFWTNRIDFEHEIIVSQVGLFGGNVGTGGNPAPAHTVIADYFYNTADPLSDRDADILTTTVNGNGRIDVNPANYDCDDTVSLTAVPALGWAFQNWSGDANGNGATINLTLDETRSVTANFVASDPHPYKLLMPAVVKP